MDIIIFNEANGQFKYSGNRPSFDFEKPDVVFQDGSVRNQEENNDKDICHSISFYTIATALTNALNLYKYKIDDDDALEYLVHYIAGIIVSVKTERVYIGDGDSCYAWIKAMCEENEEYANQYEKYLDLIQAIVDAAEYLDEEDDFLCCCVWHYIAIKSSEIARLLNSEPSNLRYGFGKWNRSIKEAYDPMLANQGSGEIEITHPYDNIRITNLLRYTIGENFEDTSIPGNIDALSFYTCTIFEDPGNPDSNIIYKGIYSSSLPMELWRPVFKVDTCTDPIYYHNYLQSDENADPPSWPAEQIPTYIDGNT